MAVPKKSGPAKRSVSIMLSLCLLGLAIPADAKKVSFQLPPDEKMSDDATPQSETAKKQSKPISLAPLGLHDDETASSAEPSETDGTLKSTVTQNDFLAKSRAGSGDKNAVATGKNESVVGKLDKSLDKGKKVEVAPLALMESEEEAEKKAETIMDSEKRQLSELWQNTIDRNPDIQFVIQKLQPTSDANHAMAATMKMLSATLFGAMNMAPFMMPGGISQVNPAAIMGMQSGAGLIQGLFQDKAAKGAKKQAISQEQATILYKIVRDTADKLVASYRDYKKENASVNRATQDLADLQSMAAEAKIDAGKAVEVEYTLRKAKRDIDEKLEQQKLYRQQLSDLAGAEAVAKLDKEMEDERGAIANLTGTGNDSHAAPGGGPFVNPLQAPAQRTAATEGAQFH